MSIDFSSDTILPMTNELEPSAGEQLVLEEESLPAIEPWISMPLDIPAPGLMPRRKETVGEDGQTRVVISTNFEEMDRIEKDEEREYVKRNFDNFKKDARRHLAWLQKIHNAVLKGTRKAWFIPTVGAFTVIVGGIAVEAVRHGRDIKELIDLFRPPEA